MIFRMREVTPWLSAALEKFPVVFATGIRQSGKTTLLRQDAELSKRRYLTLDDIGQLEAARADPAGFVESDAPLTIDEAQRCPELLLAIKASVDRKRKRGHFLLSGSAQLDLAKGVSDSLAGRALHVNVHPFTLRERSGNIQGESFLEAFWESQAGAWQEDVLPLTSDDILSGGMPSVCLGDAPDRWLWWKAFESTYLERDVRAMARIADIIPFRRLLKLLALRTAQVLNVSDVARDAHISVPTANHYLSLLEASFVITRLPPYLNNKASRLIKSPKLYMADASMAAYLADVEDLSPRADEPLRGALVETLVAQNLRGIIDARWPRAQLMYWHVQGRQEVDFVVEVGRQCMAIEVKATSRLVGADAASLHTFVAHTPHCKAALLAYNGPKLVQLGEKIWAVPIRLLLS